MFESLVSNNNVHSLSTQNHSYEPNKSMEKEIEGIKDIKINVNQPKSGQLDNNSVSPNRLFTKVLKAVKSNKNSVNSTIKRKVFRGNILYFNCDF